jgi:hypothetical protein
MVYPDEEGISVSPDTPANLPDLRRPPKLGGRGKNPVWRLLKSALGPELKYRPDPANPTGHGFIEPARPMTFDEYQEALAATQDRWIPAAPEDWSDQ